MGGCPGICRDPGPGPAMPGIHGTAGTGTKICGTVPLLKSRGTVQSRPLPNPDNYTRFDQENYSQVEIIFTRGLEQVRKFI